MNNLLNFFFSFDKLMKEKLVIPFFWLGLIVIGLHFSANALSAIHLGWVAKFVDFVNFFARVLLSLIGWRLLCEAAIALFRINNNLAPDGGKSETADIDIMEEARHAAETVSSKTKAATKTAVEKTRAATSSAKDTVEDAASETVKSAKAAVKKPAAKKPAAKKPAAKKPAAKKAASSTKSKPGPKPGSKATRDADGNLLKKDGTPRGKPGPKSKG